MNWRIGETFRALDTKDIRDCHITPGTPGRIEGIIGSRVSFFLEPGHPKQGFTVGNANVGDFNKNFSRDKAKDSNRRQRVTSNVYPNAFPTDWRSPSKRPQ